MEETSDVYRELQQHIDEYMPVGYPSTESGVELRILKHLFTPEEAKLALNLSALPESLERIHKRVKESGMSIEELEEKLDFLQEKGAIMGGALIAGKKGEKRYSLAQFAVGMFEFQIDRLTKEYAGDAHEYIDRTGYNVWFKPDTPAQMRVIPIEHSVTVEHEISTYDSIRQLMEIVDDPIVAFNCICKQTMDTLEQSCKNTDMRECCTAFGRLGDFFIERGVARKITKEEMFERLQKFEDAALVLQPLNSQNPLGICACCGDCCEVLKMMKKFPRPAELYTSNYFSIVNPEECDGCETCIYRCQMDALTTVDNIATVNLDRCIGCGLCVTTCPSNAIQLQKKEKVKKPPKDFDVLYQKIMLKKRGLWGSLKLIGKKILGMRI